MTIPYLRRLAPVVLLGAILAPGWSFAAIVHVSIDNYAFMPKALTIHSGDTVVWDNRDDVAHTVTETGTETGTASGKGFDSGALDPGKMFRHVFHKAGSYAYRCAVHPEMRGVITVEPAP